MKLHTKLFALLIGSILTTIIVVGGVAVFFSDLQTKNSAETTVKNFLDQLDRILADYRKTAIDDLSQLAELPVGLFLVETDYKKQDALYEKLLQAFQTIQSKHPEYLNIRLISAEGNVKIQTESDEIKPQTHQTPVTDSYTARFLTKTPEGAIAIAYEPKISQLVLEVFRKLPNALQPTANSSPHLVITVNLDFISNELAKSTLGTHGVLYLKNDLQWLVYEPKNQWFPKEITAPAFYDLRDSNLNFASQVMHNGHPYYFLSYRGLKQLENLTFYAGINSARVLPGMVFLLTTNKALVLATLGLFLIFSAAIYFWLVNREWLLPMTKLLSGAQELSKGSMLTPIEIEHNDDLISLAQAINETANNTRISSNQIHFFAYHDSLTRLPNRLMFTEYLNHAIAHAERQNQSLALMFLDLDNFKRINDTLGHHAGDHILREVSKRLTYCLRASDYVSRTISNQEGDRVARLGGDEFTILLTNLTDPFEAAMVAKRVLNSMAEPIRYHNHDLHVGTSIGITLYPNDATTAEDLLKNADMAMYHAKSEGKNNYQYFKESMHKEATKRLRLEKALRQGITEGEFFLEYQPQCDTTTGRIVAVEALVRWNHPDEGVKPPDEFIGIAEETGLIVPLGEWVITTACQQTKIWHDAGYPELIVSVNISGIQLNRHTLHEVVHNALKTSGLPANNLEIELTEKSIISAEEVVTETLHDINKLGVRIAMDDFGTGYSSLSYLRKFPIDKLKVDRSFVSDISNSRNENVISAILAMARSLKLPVTAEGVENLAQYMFLKERGCQFIQGHIFSPSVNETTLTDILKMAPQKTNSSFTPQRFRVVE